jgi:hypothetical protein
VTAGARRLVSVLGVVILVAVVCNREEAVRSEDGPQLPAFAQNEYWAKGGFGVIGNRVFVDVRTAKNQILLPDQSVWTGAGFDQRELVLIRNGRVFRAGKLPPGFSIVECILVSFEGGRVYFMDFANGRGGFYARSRE